MILSAAQIYKGPSVLILYTLITRIKRVYALLILKMLYLAIGDGLSSTTTSSIVSFGRADNPSGLLQGKEVSVDGATPQP